MGISNVDFSVWIVNAHRSNFYVTFIFSGFFSPLREGSALVFESVHVFLQTSIFAIIYAKVIFGENDESPVCFAEAGVDCWENLVATFGMLCGFELR